MRRSVVTTVTQAADSLDLTDLATVKDELRIPSDDTANDTWLERAISQVSRSIGNYCNRVFPVQQYRDAVQLGEGRYYHRIAPDIQPLQLANWPVTGVASVTVDGTALTTADYELDPNNGWLYRLDTSGYRTRWCGRQIVVAYSAGYAAIPADVVDAALRWVTSRFKGRDRDPMLRTEEQPGLGSRTYWGGGPPMSGGVPQEIAELLAAYRVPVVG